MVIEELRRGYHKNLVKDVIFIDNSGVPNNADRYSKTSVALARGILEEINLETSRIKSSGQTSGKEFANVTADFL